ncbi:PE-PPE domain-containing protein [Mycobacterium sp. 1423905.2]|uniref:PE family protein n=1 Tax=Mycobacterium sp. 1423905.2 TaxID=1856859 RepID=UPI0007FEEA4E|nr:PE-PPE domain-containing protein [Mycobacterium sp. 1423905.2]OBJ47832.1 PE family protein [Mycobacterium sp. 1423905.2]
MSYLIAEPQVMASVAAEIEDIGSALTAANAAAAGPTSTLLAAAGDEVSAAIANFFGAYGQQYQAIVGQIEAFSTEFQRTLGAAANAYAQAETAAVTALQGALGAPASPVLPTATLPPFPANAIQLIFGGTGVPIPTQKLITAAENLYVHGANALGVNTPEQLYPLTGVRSMFFNQSVSQGLTIMDNAIRSQIAAGQSVTVFGISQSAVIASLEMQKLAAAGNPFQGMLNFVLTGNEMNPNGGLLSRFPGLSLSSLGLDFYGATPANTPYPTAIYTLEYDGFADFPRYPLNFLADLNAVAGIVFVHPTYFDLTAAQVNSALQLPTSPGYAGHTSYYMIRTPNLPLLEPLRALPVIGNPLANLIQPDLKVLVNLGYGDPAYGFSTAPADVWTPFGLFPDVSPLTVANALATGTQQGIADFSRDISQLMAHPPALPSFTLPAPTDLTLKLGPAPTPLQVANTVASIVSTNYAVLLPTADTLTALFTSVPAYNLQLFVDQLAHGNLINAIGYPIAADIGLGTVAGAVEFLVLAEAASNTIKDIQSLIP